MIDDNAKRPRQHPRLTTEALLTMAETTRLSVAPDLVVRARLAHHRPQLHWSQTYTQRVGEGDDG